MHTYSRCVDEGDLEAKSLQKITELKVQATNMFLDCHAVVI